MNNKFLQLLLPLLTLLSLATTALAQTEQAEEPTTSGTGWSYNTSSNTLIISSSITWSEIQTTYLQQNTKNVIFTSDCGISTIQERAFAQFWQLETIILSPSVTSIATQSFHQCEAIKSFIVLSDTHTLTISEGNIELKNASFYCASETKLEFSDSDFDGISTNDITSGNGWFYDNSSNTLVILSSSAWNKIGSGETKKYLKKNTQAVIFTSAYESTKLTELTGTGAFEDFISLISVDLSNTSITSLGDYPFYGCGELTSIKFPNTLESIGESAFEDCEKLTSIDLSNTSLTSIDDNVFQGFSSLSSITLPKNLSSIGESAFDGCTSLTSIDLSNTALTSIDDNVFQGFSSLSSITLPKNLSSIGESAFDGCTSLSSINLSETSLSSIGLSAFYQCKALTTLTFPNTLSTIGESAFYGCTSLSSINLPETSLSTIGESAFYGCTSLTSIVIPASITSISQRTFYGCTSLASIIIPASVTKIEDFAFSHCPAKNVYIESNTELAEPQVIILGTNSNQVADYGANVFTPDADATLHYNSLYTNIGAEGTTQNFRYYFTNLDDANAESTNLQSPTNNSSTPLYYDLQGRPLSQPLPNTPVIRILNNRSTIILTK